MQDIEVGYEDFDRYIVVKASDEIRVKQMFTDVDTRSVFEHLENFHCGVITKEGPNDASFDYLELVVEDGIVEIEKLQKIYNAFYKLILKYEESARLYS